MATLKIYSGFFVAEIDFFFCIESWLRREEGIVLRQVESPMDFYNGRMVFEFESEVYKGEIEIMITMITQDCFTVLVKELA